MMTGKRQDVPLIQAADGKEDPCTPVANCDDDRLSESGGASQDASAKGSGGLRDMDGGTDGPFSANDVSPRLSPDKQLPPGGSAGSISAATSSAINSVNASAGDLIDTSLSTLHPPPALDGAALSSTPPTNGHAAISTQQQQQQPYNTEEEAGGAPWPPTSLYTQSESDMQSPNTTVTTLGSTKHAAYSVPHVQNVTFSPFTKILRNVGSSMSSYNGSTGLGPGESFNGSVPASGGGYGSGPASNISLWKLKEREHTESLSEKEYHKFMQNLHKKSRQRHYTDPVDFEGILRIIGGLSTWQICIYFLVALQQIPHAMLNLCVIFMMISPDHWCYIKQMDQDAHSHASGWTSEEIKNISVPNYERQRVAACYYYDRDYHSLAHESFDDVYPNLSYSNLTLLKCSNWTFDKSEMENTIVTQWNLVCDKNMNRAHAHLVYAVGYILGCLISGLCSDKFGRKPTIVGFGVLASLLGFVLPYSNYFEVFLLVRLLGAICNEAADLAAYVLCMEITGTKYRALVGSLQQVPWAIGYTLLAGVAYMTRDWKTIQLVSAGIHSVSIILICILPESPRWLIVSNRLKEAEHYIRQACRVNKCTLPPDLELIKHAERRKWVKRNQRASPMDIFKSPDLAYRSAIVFTLWLVAALIYYGISLNLSDQSIERRRTFSGDLFLNNAIAGAIEIPVLVLCVFLLSAGRKKSQMACLILAGIMMLGACLSPKGEALRPLKLMFMLLGKAAAQAAFNILYIFTSELYPTVIRNSVIGFASMVARLGAGVSGYIAILSDVTLPFVPLIIFAVFAFGAGTLAVFLPETLNQPLPETLKDAVEFLGADTYTGCSGGNQFSQSEDHDLMQDVAQQVNNCGGPTGSLPEPFSSTDLKVGTEAKKTESTESDIIKPAPPPVSQQPSKLSSG